MVCRCPAVFDCSKRVLAILWLEVKFVDSPISSTIRDIVRIELLVRPILQSWVNMNLDNCRKFRLLLLLLLPL
jgi:hypothetical protein